MSSPTYFVQECPTCGRRLHIRVEHLGRQVVCQHCSGKFVASDPAAESGRSPESAHTLLRRVDELLQDTPQPTSHPRAANPR